MTRVKEFDYEKKIWGEPKVEPSPFYIQGLKLFYALEDPKVVRGRVLDIGCGAGNIPKAIKKYRSDLEVWGVDISKKAITTARINPQGVHFKLGSAQDLPFGDSFFDAVTMFDILEHVPSPRQALGEVKRVLKKGGLFHIFLPLDKQPGTLYYLLYKFGWQPKDRHTGHLYVFSNKDFARLVGKAGLKLTKKLFSFHWFFSIFDILYFSLLEVFNIKAPTSIEGMIEGKKGNPFVFLFNFFYRLVIALGYFESRLLVNIPGGGGHFTVLKKR